MSFVVSYLSADGSIALINDAYQLDIWEGELRVLSQSKGVVLIDRNKFIAVNVISKEW